MATAKKTVAPKQMGPQSNEPLLPHIGPAVDVGVPYPGVAPVQITNPANTAPLTDKKLAAKMYETMCTIRAFEESVKKDFLNGEIPGFTHLYIGEEAIATGICAALKDTDLIESTHRGHGHCIAKGADVNSMMAEIFGKKDGLCKGKGGSMHIADFSVGMLGANGVVGGGYNLATGAALAQKLVLKNDHVSVVFFGDGASNRGTFHEAANVAGAWKLPVLSLIHI